MPPSPEPPPADNLPVEALAPGFSTNLPGSPSKAAIWARRLAWLAGGVLLVGVASWVLVPPILKNQLEKRASEGLGRSLTVGRIDFKPWSLELELKDIAVAKADGAAPQLTLRRLYLDASLQSLRRLAPVLDALQIEGLDVKLTHLGGGRYDIDDIIARLNKPPEKPVDPNAPPPGFALFNLALREGSLDFTDQSVGKTHQLRALNLTVPFLSNLDASRQVKTEPRLAFSLNGSQFDSQAASTPFTQSHKTDADIRISGLDLKPYLGYLPVSLPMRLVAAVLDADVKLAFVQNPQTAVKLSGTLQGSGIKLLDGAQQDLLAFDGIKVVFDDVRPLEQVAKLTLLELNAPTLQVRRDAAGRLNLLRQGAGASAPQPTAAPIAAPGTAAEPGWKVELAKAALNGGHVQFQDDTTQPAARLSLQDLSLQAQDITWPFARPVPKVVQFKGTTRILGAGLAQPGGRAPEAASLQFEGSATDKSADVNLKLGHLALGMAAPYLAGFLEPRLSGDLASDLAVSWKPDELKLAIHQLTLSQLALRDRSTPVAASTAEKPVKPAPVGKKQLDAAPLNALASLKKLEILDAQVNLTHQSVAIGKVSLTQAAAAVERDAGGHWMFERWLSLGGNKPEAGNAWAVSVKDMLLDGGAFGFTDHGVVKPVVLDVSAVRLGVKDFVLNGKKPFPVTASFKLKLPQGEPGALDFKGSLVQSPFSAKGTIVATQIPVHAFEPYFGAGLNIELLRADLGFKGDVNFANGANGPTVRLQGDSVLEEFRANTLAAGAAAPVAGGAASPTAQAAAAGGTGLKISEELLTWKLLSVRGLDVALSPGAATSVTVAETALTDFFARVMIDPGGRINLQDLVKSAAGQSTDPAISPAPNATNSGANNVDSARAIGQNDPNAGAAATSGAQAARLVAPVPATIPASGPEAIINIGPISLINGKVFFSDQFIRPNYSANLSELNGRLSAFSSVPGQISAPGGLGASTPTAAPVHQMADLELRGRAEGTAALEILGKLNPLAKPLALDIKAKVRDLELPPLSPYSIKYAGHGIERGKLSVDLAYLVLPSGQLEAKNKIILNQLKFGDKVEGAPASLPVRLAVALLADRNGVIDLDLPVSGSLNDPQFSLGPIIFKVIINVIVKAITAPFSLLAAAFGGGGDELSQVAFAPGSAALGAEARSGLEKVAKALLERPGLKLTVIGTSSLEEEREAYKRERLKALLQAEKRRVLVVGGSLAAASPAPASAASEAAGALLSAPVVAVVGEAEIPVLMKEVYRRSDFPKPRNPAGVTREPTVEEMQALLLANIVVTEDAMRELALQRGVAVKDYLASKQLPVERLFLGNVRTGGADMAVAGAEVAADGKPAAAPTKWSPRAELNLATN